MMSSITAFSRLVMALYFGVVLTNAFSSIQPSFQRRTKSQLYAEKTAIDVYLEDANYNQIMQGAKEKIVLVDCCAHWCGPCKLIDPFLVEASQKYSNDLDIVKFDVEAPNAGGIKVEFLLQDVMPQALPSLILFRDGKALAKHTGALSKQQLFDFIETNMNAADGAADEALLVNAAGGGATKAEKQNSTKGKINLGGLDKDDYML